MADKEIKYSIIDHIADLGETDSKGWGKEVNVMTWGNSKNPVIDIRKWNREINTMGKGISLKLEEFKQIQKISNLENYFETEDDSDDEE